MNIAAKKSLYCIVIVLLISLLQNASAQNTVLNNLEQTPKIDPENRAIGYLKFGWNQADIEEEALAFIQENYPNHGFKKVYILSDRYQLKRNSSGKLKERSLQFDFFNDQCKAYDITLKQKRIGKGWGVFELKSINGFYPFDCEDIPYIK